MKKTVCLLLCIMMIFGAIILPAAAAEPAKSQLTLDDLKGETFGVITGMSTDMIYAEYIPEAQLNYFNTTADTINAVKSGQIAGFLDDEPVAKYLVAHTDGLEYIDEIVGEPIDTAFFVGKTELDRKLLGELNEFILKLKSDGTIDEIFDLWYGTDEENQHLTIPTEGINGTVRVATYGQSAPVVMYKDGELCGVEIDILCRFANEYGYALEFDDMDFGAIINAVNSGRCNIGSGFFSVTEERKQSVTFTEPYYYAGCLMVVAAEETQEGSFIAGLKESFHKTFIKEDRWKLIVEGIETTLIISVCAAVLGTVLGFGLCLLRRMKNKFVHALTTVYIRILQGTPLLVLLMILYYIVFAKSGTSGVFVAVIAFAMNFAAYTCEMFRTGIDGVDIGQTEAAYAIGFTRSQTFFKIILPQAALHFLPVYKGEFISLVKMTSIVGYIAVQDLTKMSDIIRSRTYEAFFPLIATAIIYFILTALLTGLLKVIEIKVEPDRKNRTVKGVKMQ